jgi:hypothetical protein
LGFISEFRHKYRQKGNKDSFHRSVHFLLVLPGLVCQTMRAVSTDYRYALRRLRFRQFLYGSSKILYRVKSGHNPSPDLSTPLPFCFIVINTIGRKVAALVLFLLVKKVSRKRKLPNSRLKKTNKRKKNGMD